MTTRPSRRDPILGTWLALSVGLNIIGMASLVDGIVVWTDFIRQLLGIYWDVIQRPIWLAVESVWPETWPRLPPAAIDIFVVWSCLFLSVNLALYRATGKTIFSSAFARVAGLKSFLVFLLVSGMMFIAVPFGVARKLVTPSSYRSNPYFPDRPNPTRSVLYSLLFVVGIFVLLLFINFQIKRVGPQAV